MKQNLSITDQLRELGIGDSASFPITKMRSIRTTASERGIVWGKTFSTSLNREEKTITVTRKA